MTGKIDQEPLSPEAAATSGDWLRISADMTDAVDLITGRKDVVVRIAPGAGSGAKACFHEDSAVIEIDGNLLDVAVGGELDKVQPIKYENRTRYPDVWGLLVHECAHARHTRWKKKLWPQILRDEIEPNLIKAAELLEEVRAENTHLDRRSWDTRWLRASAARHLIGDDVKIEDLTQEQAAARVVTLVGGRITAGVVDRSEVDEALKIAEGVLGKERSAQLRDIVKRTLRIRDSDADGMLALAREWLDVAGVPPDPQQNGLGGFGEPYGTAEAEMVGTLAQALEAAGKEIGKNGGQQDGSGKWWSTGIGGTTPVKFRPAAPSEKRQAAELTRRLRPYLIPERSVTRVSQVSPPGRLDMDAALTRSAQEAMSLLPSSEPWLHLDRRVMPTPPLRVGISVDVSGSLDSIAHHSMRLAYVLAAGFAGLPDARVSTMAFGSDFSIWPVKPGEVPVYKYDSGTSAETEALEALVDRCSFYRRGNARLFIEVGDAMYDYSDMLMHAKLYRKLIKAGVRIIFLLQEGAKYHLKNGYRQRMTQGEWLASMRNSSDSCLGVPGVHIIPISGSSSPEAAVSAVIDDIVKLLTGGGA